MQFVHLYVDEWARHRSDIHVTTYDNLESMDYDLRQTFGWMLDKGLTRVQCGSDQFQIRQGEMK